MSQKKAVQPLLLETIKIEDGVIFNIDYHQKRCTLSRKELYDSHDVLTLNHAIKAPQKGLYRCRIIYAQQIKSIEYIPYIEKNITTFKVVNTSLDYHLKYANRTALDILVKQHENYDDIIFEKEGFITDTSIANIAFYDGKHWVTPSTPLLHGTMRQKLIDENFLHIKEIRREEIPNYQQVALINAMLGFKILKHFTID